MILSRSRITVLTDIEYKTMRAYYATHKHIRLFVLGVPEGWQVGLYDLQKRQWIDVLGWIHDGLKEAKISAREKAAALLGATLPDTKWH